MSTGLIGGTIVGVSLFVIFKLILGIDREVPAKAPTGGDSASSAAH
jgi:hypothetical protein